MPPKKPRQAILLRHNNFNPITYTDLRMMEVAREHLLSLGFEVGFGILSVDNDFERGPGFVSHDYRLNMCDFAASHVGWLTVDRWAAIQDASKYITLGMVLAELQKKYHGNIEVKSHKFDHIDWYQKPQLAPSLKDLSIVIRRPSFGVSHETFKQIYGPEGQAYTGHDALMVARKLHRGDKHSVYEPVRGEEYAPMPRRPSRSQQVRRDTFGAPFGSTSSDAFFGGVPPSPGPDSAFEPMTPGPSTSTGGGFDPRLPHIPPGTVIRPKSKKSRGGGGSSSAGDAADIFSNFGKKLKSPTQVAALKSKPRPLIDIVSVLTTKDLQEWVPRCEDESSAKDIREVLDAGVIVVATEDEDPMSVIDSSDVLQEYVHNIRIVVDPIKFVVPPEHVRMLAHRGESIRFLVPDWVADYIERAGLYAV